MSFDTTWFNELRGVTDIQLNQTRHLGIDGYVPHVGELCRDGHVSSQFLEETFQFVRLMLRTSYRFDTFFRAYEQHIVDFPKGRAFRKQWNVAFTAGETSYDDNVRIGIGFRLSEHEASEGIVDYLGFRDEVSRRQKDFDRIFSALGNYYEIMDSDPPRPLILDNYSGYLSDVVIHDTPPLNGWRFFGKCLRARNHKDNAVICSHNQLRDEVVDVFDLIQRERFGM